MTVTDVPGGALVLYWGFSKKLNNLKRVHGVQFFQEIPFFRVLHLGLPLGVDGACFYIQNKGLMDFGLVRLSSGCCLYFCLYDKYIA